VFVKHRRLRTSAYGMVTSSTWSASGMTVSVERRRPRGEYATPRGCAAAYFPEANVLVPLDSTAETSNTPTSKSIVIRPEPATKKTSQ